MSDKSELAVCQNLVPLVNIKIAGKWMFIPLKIVLIGNDPYPVLMIQHLAVSHGLLHRGRAAKIIDLHDSITERHFEKHSADEGLADIPFTWKQSAARFGRSEQAKE